MNVIDFGGHVLEVFTEYSSVVFLVLQASTSCCLSRGI